MIEINQRRNDLIELIDYFAQEALQSSEEGKAWCDTTDLVFFNADKYSDDKLFNVYRSLVNVRPPMMLDDKISHLQDNFLKNEAVRKGITDSSKLFGEGQNIAVFRGDITTLKIDAVVNAANSTLLGCSSPMHLCIDNCIHTYAGTALRLACYKIIKAQGEEERSGGAKLTKAYNLPARYILHTVGPVIHGTPTKVDRETLASCYTSCLNLADENSLRSIAFCCISTGAFCFPKKDACSIAVSTVRNWQKVHPYSDIRVVFDVFNEEDESLYNSLLQTPAESGQ